MRRRNAVIRIGDTLFAHGGLGKWATRVDVGGVNATVRAGIRAYQDRAQGRSVTKLTSKQEWVLEDEGPLWDREMAEGILSERAVDDILAHHYSNRVVLGHTPTDSDTIETRYDDKVFLIDTSGSDSMGGRPAALEIHANLKEDKVQGFVYYDTGAIEPLNRIRRIPHSHCVRILSALRKAP